MRRLALVLALAAGAAPLSAQSLLESTPNVQGGWTLPRWNASFVFAHRFEPLSGGDETINLPTLSLALGLPLGFTAGLDRTTNSETVPANLAGNETEYWLRRAFRVAPRAVVAGTVAHNDAAGGMDGAVSARAGFGRFTVLGEARGYSKLFGSDDAALAGAAGASVRLTPYLAVQGDWGRVLGHDSLDAVWSAGVAMAIPGSPHTFSLYAANNGAATLQGVSRSARLGRADSDTRYGFTFTVPLGSGSRWARIFRPGPPPAAPAASGPAEPAREGVVRVDVRDFAFGPREVRIRAGQSVEWVNADTAMHTATADDGSWSSPELQQGGRWTRRFDRPGRFGYYCIPHPDMTGVVIVEPAAGATGKR
ncbi:MAG TPA: cupredoxin family copper-binding protein [Longimicrobiaceae bacterium]